MVSGVAWGLQAHHQFEWRASVLYAGGTWSICIFMQLDGSLFNHFTCFRVLLCMQHFLSFRLISCLLAHVMG